MSFSVEPCLGVAKDRADPQAGIFVGRLARRHNFVNSAPSHGFDRMRWEVCGCFRSIFQMKIGVLALQGDFDAHRRRLEELGADVVLVRKPEQLDAIDGLVIPGGESSAFLKILGETGFAKLKEFVRVKPTFGTCAGAIMLAKEITNPD